jgi:hypothetical protein
LILFSIPFAANQTHPEASSLSFKELELEAFHKKYEKLSNTTGTEQQQHQQEVNLN